MKSKELIKQLQEADPSGEIEVCVGNVDIWECHVEPAYWDGRLQLLVRDPALAPYFDIVGAKYCTKGSKLTISTMSVTDVLWDNPEAVIDYSELGANEDRYKVSDEKTRQASRDVELKVSMDSFHRWVQKKAEEIRPGTGKDECRGSADGFYAKHLKPSDPIKDLPPKKDTIGGKEYEVWPSVNDRQYAMWDDTLQVYWGGGWGIRKLDGTAVEEP